MHPGSGHHQMEDVQPQIFSCSTDYIKNVFYLHKSMLTSYMHLGTWNTHATTADTC